MFEKFSFIKTCNYCSLEIGIVITSWISLCLRNDNHLWLQLYVRNKKAINLLLQAYLSSEPYIQIWIVSTQTGKHSVLWQLRCVSKYSLATVSMNKKHLRSALATYVMSGALIAKLRGYSKLGLRSTDGLSLSRITIMTLLYMKNANIRFYKYTRKGLQVYKNNKIGLLKML